MDDELYLRVPGKPVEDATWHWRSKCRHYRSLCRRADAIQTSPPAGARPASGELCNLCLSYERKAEAAAGE